MDIKLTIKRKLIVNGKEYGSPEEMPEGLRTAYARAAGAISAATTSAAADSKIVFQGVAYSSPDEMPEDARKLYELVRATRKPASAATQDDNAGFDAGPRTVVERDGVFISVAREPAKAADTRPPHKIEIELKLGRTGAAVVIAALIAIVWYLLGGAGTNLR